MIRLLSLILSLIPESALHALHRETHGEWRRRYPTGAWPIAETGLRRAEVKDALTRASAMARSRIVGDFDVELRERIELILLIETSPNESPSPGLRAYASLAGWMRRKFGRGPELLGLCESCEQYHRGAYHLDREGSCSTCGGPFLADVPLARIAIGEDAPARFEVNLDAAINPPHLQEAHRV